MTVESSVNRAQYETNGTTGPWTVPFYFLDDSHLSVIYTDAAGNETTLTLTTHYSVAGAGDPSGGSVSTVTAYTVGGYITILRDVPSTQLVDYTETDSFPAETHERALDQLTMLLQQLQEVVGRALVFSPSDTAGSSLPAAAARAGLLLGFNAQGQVLLSAPASGSAADLALNLADTTLASKGVGLVGIDQSLPYDPNTAGGVLSGLLRDIRNFDGIVADGVTNDITALQAAFRSARDGGYGIWIPAGVKVFVEFSVSTPQVYIDGAINIVGADRFSSGFLVKCNYDMGNVHAPLFCWGVPSKGAAVNKVTGRVHHVGWWLDAGCQKFERMNHIYGAQDFFVDACYADFTDVTWPAADGGHPSGYQAGGWWSSNVQPTFATGQSRDRNIWFINNVGFASAEYQNAESIGITRCDGLRYITNYLVGWSDDMAAHECTDVLYDGNYYAAVSGRLYAENSRRVKIVNNVCKPLLRPVAGTYLGPTRSYIGINMSTQYAAVSDDAPNYDVTIAHNSIHLPSGSYCSPAIICYGVQDGLSILDNKIYNDGATSPATGIQVSTLYRAGWTGPAGNPDFAAGGAIRMRSVEIRGNQELGTWASNEGNISVVVYAGGATADIVGPVVVGDNISGSYNVTNEGVEFMGSNRALASSAAPFANVSAVALYRSGPRWAAPMTAAQNLEGTTHPAASPATILDTYGLDFIAQRAGSIRGVMLTLTAAMTAANYATARILVNGVQVGVDTATSSISSAPNSYRYLVNYSGSAAMVFAKGDKVQLRLYFDPGQLTAVVGKAELMYLYQ